MYPSTDNFTQSFLPMFIYANIHTYTNACIYTHILSFHDRLMSRTYTHMSLFCTHQFIDTCMHSYIHTYSVPQHRQFHAIFLSTTDSCPGFPQHYLFLKCVCVCACSCFWNICVYMCVSGSLCQDWVPCVCMVYVCMDACLGTFWIFVPQNDILRSQNLKNL